MSAISLVQRDIGPDGIARNRTRVKLLIHSHNSDNVIDLSLAVFRFNTNKNIKSVGQMQFSLTAERNWLNVIYPNDHVNCYVERADQQGWTRLFYGFVDNIEEATTVDSGGAPFTMYSVSCSDFQKVFEKTQIYFNPHVASRSDFSGGFIGTPNIGGLGLMTRGVRVNGSPSDLITNLVLLLMGFGTQFILPTSYNPRLADRIRAQRAEFILNRLSEDAKNQVLNAGGYAAFLERIRSQTNVTSDTLTLTSPDSTSATDVQRAERARYSNAAIRELGGTGAGVGQENSRGARERGIEAYNVLNTTLPGYPPSFLDVLDVFTFNERTAIDGYMIGAPVWERQGSIMEFLRSLSNEIVNELFFDLRPVSRDGGLTAGTDFSRDWDEIEGNRGDGTVPDGILYVPAIVMREYPFATVHSLDASNISLTLRNGQVAGAAGIQETLGHIHFGAIFSDQPNVPGRHVVTVPNMNPDDQVQGSSDVGRKHLDVSCLRSQDIVSSKLTRSDDDHFNLFELYSDAILGNDARFFMQDLLPIITPIHIVRHGLRVRSLNTRFGRFSLDTVQRSSPAPVQTQPQDEAPAPAAVPARPPVLPVELVESGGRYTRGHVSRGNTWRYRQKVFNGSRPYNNVAGNPVPAAGTPYWRFHNGVDIVGVRGTPIRAVRDGRIVMAAPVGTSGTAGYGNVVAIYHPDIDMYSIYAHMDGFAPGVGITSSSRRLRDYAAREYVSGGNFTPVNVSAGDVIGYMGDTDFLPPSGTMGVHLHFEFNLARNGRSFPSSSDRSRLTPDVFRTSPPAVADALVSASEPSQPSEAATISQDPVRILAGWGLTLPVGPRVVPPDVAPPEDPGAEPDPADAYPGDEAEDFTDTDHEVAPTPTTDALTDPTPTPTVNPGFVDTPSTRRQLARWALLNDHWYQHNLEYLAGSFESRGTPETRVGYRLDIEDRNLSFYVESVGHSWTYGKAMTSTLHVTRGQPTNPHVSYVLPYINGFDPTETQRQTSSRLASYFIVPDPLSVRRATKIERHGVSISPLAARGGMVTNEVDTPNENQTLKDKYNEQILQADTVQTPIDLEKLMQLQEASIAQSRGGSSATIEANPQGGIDPDVVSELFPTLEDL